MAKKAKLPLRSEVKTADTWDLRPLYTSDRAWARDIARMEDAIPKFARFQGRLGKSPSNLRKCLEFEIEFGKLAELLGSYAFLRMSEDVADPKAQAMVARYRHVSMHAQEAASFIAPEIQAIPKTTIARFLASKELRPHRFSLEKLLRYRPHILSEKEERLLAMQGEVAGSASRIFGQLNDADFKFGVIQDEKGRDIELTHGSMRTILESPQREMRKRAFDQYYKEYEDHANTLAATLSASVLQDVYQARARNFPSAREASLFEDNVPVAVYESLIAAVRANLDTVHHYLDVRRKALRLRDLHIYDNYVPLLKAGPAKTTYEQAAATICDALAPLGSQYCSVLEKGLRGRWVDRYENKGKRSGAFSGGGFAGPPYILMNYKEAVIDSMFTLAHEAGHSMHTYHSARNQPFQYYDYTIFVAEVASTFNEQLLGYYLRERARDDRARAFLISKEIDEIRFTLIRQTMFAEYEKIVHAIAEAGEPLTLERMRDEYRTLLEAYFGPRFKLDELLTLEAFRIPHFYRAFYVYKYATGLSAAIALAQRVIAGDSAARDKYLNFLRAGGSKFPLDLLRDAGVDMESPAPVNTAMSRFKALIVELEGLI